MNINPLLAPTLIVGLALFWLTTAQRAWPASSWKRGVLAAGAIVAAVPGVLFDLYYAHLFDRAGWFYQFRSIPGTELTAAGLGFTIGALVNLLPVRTRRIRGLGAVAVAAALLVPYIKPIIAPLDLSSLRNRHDGPVCLQSSGSTCGPACVTTLLRHAGISATEAQMARECYTSGTGTENWYLARTLRRHGLVDSHYVILHPNPTTLPYPSIAGLGFGRSGHFVTVLDKTPNPTSAVARL